ncbi:MAG: SAM-dependent methyltransferase, partial [Actinomycetota bacterium]|nr:SAM-dependent methyltransferase [Actinomycetota bacterium]
MAGRMEGCRGYEKGREVTTGNPVDLDIVGVVESPLRRVDEAPRQPDEGAPAAWLVIEPALQDALRGLEQGTRIVVVTWLHLADRTMLLVHPRGDASRPEQGVFSTRSPHRPNPIGLHTVTVRAVEGHRVLVDQLE